MDDQTARKLMLGTFRALEEAPDADSRQRWFRDWITRHRVTLSGLASASGLSRSTIGSLAGKGNNTSWEKLAPEKIDQVARAMNLIEPITAEELRRELGLAPSGRVDHSAFLRGVEVGGIQDMKFHVAVDPTNGKPPHVFRGPSGTYVSSVITSDIRLGRLVALHPV